jgi:uncharacterized membrane protein
MNIKEISFKKIIDISFIIFLIYKCFATLFDITVGFIFLFIPSGKIYQLINWLTSHELMEDKNDWFMKKFITLCKSYSIKTQYFLMIYFISHGILELITVLLLWKEKLWAFQLAVIVLLGVIIYQIYEFTLERSIIILFLILLDIVTIVLIILKYRNIKNEKVT